MTGAKLNRDEFKIGAYQPEAPTEAAVPPRGGTAVVRPEPPLQPALDQKMKKEEIRMTLQFELLDGEALDIHFQPFGHLRQKNQELVMALLNVMNNAAEDFLTNGYTLRFSEYELIAHGMCRRAGCKCPRPLLGWTEQNTPRCRLCGTEVPSEPKPLPKIPRQDVRR